jgi:hypothetical protein
MLLFKGFTVYHSIVTRQNGMGHKYSSRSIMARDAESHHCDGQRCGYRPPRRCDKEFVQFHPAAVARDVIVLSSTTEKTLDSREDLHIFNLVFASSDLKN